uniref:Armadillo-like repeats domain-containing protein n=1 Tax=Chlamydomonas euryale TaxID=1486919 RepID=A0A7R9V160_9CHLO
MPGRLLALAGGALLAITVGVTARRLHEKRNTAEAKRRRQIARNKLLVTELSKYLPERRFKLKPGVVGSLRRNTGFNEFEIFRKYLWYLLRERTFDAEAIEDLVALKTAAELSDDQVADALAERAQRVYDKYGTLMLRELEEETLSASGLERKATCKALFQKLLYLSECERLVAQGSQAAGRINLRVIFGASERDVNRLRIVSLYEVDLEAAFSQAPGVNSAAGVDAQPADIPGDGTTGRDTTGGGRIGGRGGASLGPLPPVVISDDEADEEPPHFQDDKPRRSA